MKPKKSSPARPAAKAPCPSSPLVNSPAEAKRESARLRRGRDEMESAPTEADTSIRSSLI